MAGALFNKGVTLGTLGRSEEEIAVYDEVVKRFGEAGEAALRAQVADALFNKGITLGTLGRSEEKIAVYDEVVKRFGEAGEAALRAQVADALFNKGITLGRLGRDEEAIAVYDEVAERFGKADEAALRAQAAKALNSMAFTRLTEAKRLWKEEASDEKAQELLRVADNNVRDALAVTPDDAVKLGNKAYIAFLLGRLDEARETMTRAITLGGEELRQAELQDAEIHTLPQDEDFKAMVRSIPRTSE